VGVVEGIRTVVIGTHSGCVGERRAGFFKGNAVQCGAIAANHDGRPARSALWMAVSLTPMRRAASRVELVSSGMAADLSPRMKTLRRGLYALRDSLPSRMI